MLAPYISYTVRDGKGVDSSFQIYAPSSTAIADLIDFGNALTLLLIPLLTGHITNVAVCVGLTLPSGTPAANSDVEEGGRFIFPVTGGISSTLTLPTFDESLVVAGTPNIDLAAPTVDAFIDALTNGITVPSTAVVAACDYREGDFGVCETAYETFAGRRARGRR